MKLIFAVAARKAAAGKKLSGLISGVSQENGAWEWRSEVSGKKSFFSLHLDVASITVKCT
jgi:hypothetical protein